MKKLLFVLCLLLSATISFAHVQQLCSIIDLEVRKYDPTGALEQPERTPIEIPCIQQEGQTLYFDSSCHGCLLRIVDAENSVVYSTTITSSTLVLPSSLEGVYELQIIRDNWCFYGEITL